MITNLAKKKKRGFTLVEVIIVLAIIAIIAAIAIPNLTKVRQDSKRKADTQTCETIQRTITTLIVDETIGYKTSGEKILYITPETSNIVTQKTPNNLTIPSDIDTYFKDLKKPQQDDGAKYIVTIGDDGSVVSVYAAKEDNTTFVK